MLRLYYETLLLHFSINRFFKTIKNNKKKLDLQGWTEKFHTQVTPHFCMCVCVCVWRGVLFLRRGYSQHILSPTDEAVL